MIILDDNNEILQKTNRRDVNDYVSRNEDEFETQKAAVVDEIQRLNREANIKRDVIIKLMGLLKILDPLFSEGKDKCEAMRKKLQPPKKLVKGET